MKPLDSIKLAVFDFDSTLMDGETIDSLALDFGVGEQVSEITHRAMSGELDFFESLSVRVGLLEGMSEARAKEICENLPLMNGAQECVSALKRQGTKVVCFSGGFRLATAHFAKILGLDADFSNILHAKNGVLTGKVGGEMMFGSSKGDMLLRLQSLLGITRAQTLVVGDGANDLSMFAHADFRAAFCAKPALKKEANIIIETKDLREVWLNLMRKSSTRF
ncbi:phosphoserine phosphatase SerB [Helicobacter sp. CLO-3]|uniref:phosphoserine phosphatase SerB n=1 Tax=unclassified Helicobacter TaxID=2593540 RepID=UPI000804AC16|nr:MULTISPECIES: phosphoserine phosphatase SerB [unclassified Helicobacter]OBV28961.1 phosphoserine phosphatase SerB [Helicobacter sp. CLO-3]OHU84806.1 phosphoserine phosphatase SerB [Helicobacter sp. CLO-3]